jgi:hypothetical protein
MPKSLQDVPVGIVRVGDRCISAIGQQGIVIYVNHQEHGHLRVAWTNGQITETVFEADGWLGHDITYLGQGQRAEDDGANDIPIVLPAAH